MTRREFIRQYSAKREAQLRRAYDGDPHAESCIIASMIEVEGDALKLWRKHRAAFRMMDYITPIGPANAV